jgi:hypothetical protein
MDDIFDIEEEAQEAQHSSECFCQLCRPYLVTDQEETGVTSTDFVAA